MSANTYSTVIDMIGNTPMLDAHKLNSNIYLLFLKREGQNPGRVERLIEHPAIITHASIPQETLAELGISDGLGGLSCGIEDCEDLIADLKNALH